MPDDYDLLPVDYVPTFAEPFAVPQTPVTPEQTARFREGVTSLFKNTVGAPGVAAQPIVPETPGFVSDVDVARQIATDEHLKNWAPQQALNMVGQGAPMAVEGAAGMAGGKLAAKALEAAEETPPIRAYHGSPHDFERFDMSKIGTGEGAQSYGSGLYFAENPEVARDYRRRLAPNTPENVAPDEHAIAKYQPDWDKLVQERQAVAGKEGRGDTSHVDAKMDAVHQKMVEDTIARNPNLAGRMYEVAINANPEHFLDWDKPLSEQHPKVQGFFGKSGLHDENSTGAELYRLYGRGQEDKIASSLNQSGIPGIKYLDQGSRTPDPAYVLRNIEQAQSKIAEYEGKGYPEDLVAPHRDMLARNQELLEKARTMNRTSNYVVFDDKLIDIIKKYGLAGLVAGGAGHFATKAVDYTPQFDDAKHAKGGAVKLSHASVGYTAQSTHLPQKCGRCTMFLPPSGCTLVQSPIKAGGWCRRFEKE